LGEHRYHHVMIDLIVLGFQKFLSFGLAFVVLLGLLIFVHELGHFLVAKFYGVRVEVFSLGFGKKIWRYKPGDTEYCLSLIPLGGYVKMYGDDPSADIPEEQKQYSFLHKPVFQRIAVVLAGPLMNLFFAALIFGVIALLGEKTVSNHVGDVPALSAAYEAGFRSGDIIQAVDGNAYKAWDEIEEYIEARAGKQISFSVQNTSGDLTSRSITVSPVEMRNTNLMSTRDYVGQIDGLSPVAISTQIGISDPNSLAGQAGLKSGDAITALDGTNLRSWFEAERVFAKSVAEKLKNSPSGQNAVSVDFELTNLQSKDSMVHTLELPAAIAQKIAQSDFDANTLQWIGLHNTELFIEEVVEGSAAQSAGLIAWDRLISVNAEPLNSWESFVKAVRSYDSDQAPLKVEVARAGQNMFFDLVPQITEQTNSAGFTEKNFAIGVKTALRMAEPVTVIVKANGIKEVLSASVNDTVEWVQLTALSFLKLLKREVSAKSIGGPIMILQLSGKTFEMGLSPYLKIMAIISINLFILNLLPIPVLDGGHLVFFSIEALRGAPLSIRKMEIAQQIGLVLLLSLMLLALFNDFSRIFSS